VSWERFKNLITRNWREKLLALVLAFLFWYMVKAQSQRSAMPYGSERVPRAVRP